MGYSYRNGGQIKDWWPDDTATELWLSGESTIGEIMDRAKAKWGESIHIDSINIEPRYEHTSCLTYDQYDPGDYTNFLLITLLIK